MSRASSLINKVDGIMKKFAPLERTAYKRIATRVGGDALTGRKGSVSYTDTLLNPQPIVNRIGRERVTGHHAPEEAIITSSGIAITADDYEVLFSVNAITLSDLGNPDFLLVLKDQSNNVETLRALDNEKPGISGIDVAYVVFMRSTKRP